MSCKYVLKGREFKSELELDDFLLERYPMKAKLGDIVFSTSITNDLLFGLNILSENDKITAKAELAFINARRKWHEDGESYEFLAPYIGVNAFLSGRIGVRDKLLFPEFNENNYWYGLADENGVRDGGRFKAWSVGDYTKDEIDLFFGNETPFPIRDRAQAEEYKKKMENKWENQCLYGDAVHAIFLAYFSKDGDVYRKDTLSDPIKLQAFKDDLNALKFRRKDDSYKSFTELVNDRIFNSVIAKCKELADYFDKRYPGAMFFPEYKMVTPIDNGGTTEKLMGIIDLLIIDAKGCPHVIDYKTSPHPFEDLGDIKGFSAAKKLAYTYQIGTYGRMLGKLGFNIDDTDYLVVPMQLADFLNINHEYDHFSFSGINFKGTESNIFHNITNDINSKETIVAELNDFADVPVHYEINTDGIISNTVEGMQTWFLEYRLYKLYDRDAIIEELTEQGCLDKKNEESNKFEWKPKGSLSNFTITADTEKDLIDKVLKYRNNLPKYRRSLTNTVIKALKEGIEAGTADGVDFPELHNYGEVGVSPEWFKTKMSRYCNPNWQVCEGDKYDALKEYGVIALFNSVIHQFNFVKISTLNLKYIHNLSSTGEKTTNLAGGLGKSDLYWQTKGDSLMLLAANGNLELMETMLIINSMSQVFGDNAIVGDIEIMDPNHGFGLSATNEELMYCFNLMYKIKPLNVPNNFANGNIKMGSRLHTAYTTFHDIMSMGALENIDWSGKYAKFKGFESTLSMLDNAIHLPKEQQIVALEELIKKLKVGEGNLLLDKITTEQGILSQEHVMLYNQALLALAELKGINFRQQLKEHSQWCESLIVWKNGFSGLYLDNPGNLQSETLNLITKLVTEAYQNVRSDMQEPSARMRELVEALKKKKNIGWMEEHTILNLADLYLNLYRTDIKDDLVFKNPWKDDSLTKEEADLLKYVLTEINKNRFGFLAEEKRIANAIEYFRVPLVKGDSSAFAAKKGMLAALKDRLSQWLPSKALETAKAKAEGVYNYLNSETEEKTRSTENIFEMNNLFDKGENPSERKAILESGKYGPEYWESNLETLFLKHEFAYSMKKRIDNVMPMVKAALVHLETSGFTLNYEFNEDIKYAKDYIRNKIKNESIIDPKYEKAAAFAENLKGAASKMVLALSPVQAIYLSLQGIWNDISLTLRKPDGTNAFTKEHMMASFKSVWSELFTTSDRPTVTSLLNELYGINDMDMNTYADKLKSDLHGIHNFTNFLFKFASRPDYYNRMTMFLAKMRGDGCFEAHKVINGRLIYDSKSDKRYAAFLNDPKGTSDEVKKAKALYYAAAKQFEAEGAEVIINGEKVPFKVNMQEPMPLPRAYTNKEAESAKNLSDTIYGYYSHEKKSLVHSMLIGSLWMQFKTFWSGKKNLYLQTGGVKLEGRWVPYVEDGLAYYYQVDDKGNVREDLPPVTNDTGFPVYRWEGNWKEGIFQSLITLGSGMVKDGIGNGWNAYWYCEDPTLRLAYRSNLILFGYDITIWGLIGSLAAGALGNWVKDEKKEMDETDVMDGLRLTAMQVLVNSVKNSALDFNFIDSIGTPGFSWTPFAFEYYSRLWNNMMGVLTGDTRLYDAMIKSTSVGRLTRPIWYAINPKDEE